MNLLPLPPPPNPLTPVPGPGITRLVHTADNHLRPSAGNSTLRGQDFYNAAMSVIRIAQQMGAHAVLNVGDFFDAPELTSPVFDQMQRMHAAARAANLPVYVVMGNHDMSTPAWTNHVAQGATGIITADNMRTTVNGLEVLLLPYMTADELRVRLQAPDIQNTPPHILCWHGAVTEWTGYPVEGAITAADFPLDRLKAVLLGDIHVTKYMMACGASGQCLIGYPGATEMVKSDEPTEHFCTVLDLDPAGNLVNYALVPVDHRHVVQVLVNLPSALTDAVARIEKARDEHQGNIFVIARVLDSLTEASRLIRVAAGDKAVVRLRTFPALTFMQRTERREGAQARTPESYAKPMLGIRQDLETLVTQLCNPSTDHTALLREHITSRIGLTA